jgi:hypothetical protein
MKQNQLIPIAAVLCSLLTFSNSASAQGTAFTYQGRLNSGGSPANGSYDIAFSLYATNAGGVAIAGPVTNTAVSVTNGLFTTMVDFGNVFTGASNWLQIAVSTNGANAFSTLSPRQQLTPVPYAVYAESANATHLVGTIPAGNLSGAALLAGGNAFTGTQTVNSGSVGIGTPSPAKPLDVTGSASGVAAGASVDPSVFVRVDNAASDGGFTNSDVAGIGFGHNSTRQAIVGGTYGNDYLDFYTGGLLTIPKMRIDFGGNVGIGTNAPAALLDVNGSGHFNGAVGITGNNMLQFGAGLAGQDPNAGKIGYEAFTTNSLDIVGAGTNNTTRKIKFWAEGGANFNGKISSPMWRATNVIGSFADPLGGPLNLSGSFTSGGGTLIIFSSGSGWSSDTNGIWIGMNVNLDGQFVDGIFVLANGTSSNSHVPFGSGATVVSGIAAGTHTIQLTTYTTNTKTDGYDWFRVSVLELPF